MHKAPTVGQLLLQEIKTHGVKTVYGIPGDLIIKFFRQIEGDPELRLCTFSYEPAVGFAAIGAARATHRPAVACVTYGPGALGLFNSVACAYSEKVPLIVVAGAPSRAVAERNFLVHHTVKGFDTQRKVYSEVTAETVVLDNPATAAQKIAAALTTCKERMLPVYIELPSDMVDATVPTTEKPAITPIYHKEALESATEYVSARLSAAAKPVFMVGVEAIRFGLVDQIVAAAKKLGIPVVSTMIARDYMPVGAEGYFGVYLGKAASQEAAQSVEQSDFVLMLGEDVSDVNFGMQCADLRDGEIVRCVSAEVKAVGEVFRGVSLAGLVSNLSAMASKERWFSPSKLTRSTQTSASASSPLTSDGVIDVVNQFFHEGGEMPVVSDTGDLLFASLRLECSSVIGSSFYGTMSFGVPAAMGYAVESGRRPLVLVGDGAFQMTGQEISHCPRLGINPIFIVSNNRSWGMEQMFHASPINGLVDWQYARMAELWGGKGYVCRAAAELYEALRDAKGQAVFSLIEVETNANNPSTPLLKYVSDQRGRPPSS